MQITLLQKDWKNEIVKLVFNIFKLGKKINLKNSLPYWRLDQLNKYIKWRIVGK